MKKVLLVLLALLVAAVTAPAAKAVTPLRPAPTPPDTESVLILHGAFNYPGYWWDHTDLTVAVQAHPNVDEESLAAVHQAIADWDYALRQEFGGLITLTDVTDQNTAKHKADIVLHYNPTAGGTVFGGYAVCGANSCPNVIVRSDLPQPGGFTYPPQYLYYVTMHELGHALGLGHAQPLTNRRISWATAGTGATASCRRCRSATSRASRPCSRGRSKASTHILRRSRRWPATEDLPGGAAARLPRRGASDSRRHAGRCREDRGIRGFSDTDPEARAAVAGPSPKPMRPRGSADWGTKRPEPCTNRSRAAATYPRAGGSTWRTKLQRSSVAASRRKRVRRRRPSAKDRRRHSKPKHSGRPRPRIRRWPSAARVWTDPWEATPPPTGPREHRAEGAGRGSLTAR